jgi:hypothetical protein
MIEVIGGILVVVLVGLIFGQYGLRHVYGYRIANGRVEVVLFGLVPMRWVYLGNIKEIRTVSSSNGAVLGPWDAERWGNRIVGSMVLIETHKGISKKILITPENADDFVRNVELAIQSS